MATKARGKPTKARGKPTKARGKPTKARGKPTKARGEPTGVCVETGAKKVFASALEWPGWSRSGKTEQAALDALASYAPRYAVVPRMARIAFPARSADAIEVVERQQGSASTDFGIPAEIAKADARPTNAAEAKRLAALVTAAWALLDEVAATAPAELRKGPRGGGRDRDKMIGHVIEAEAAYARKLGIKHKPPAIDDIEAIEALREAIAAALSAPSEGSPLVPGGWPVRYAARRIAWHVLDHVWEMQDRSDTVG